MYMYDIITSHWLLVSDDKTMAEYNGHATHIKDEQTVAYLPSGIK